MAEYHLAMYYNDYHTGRNPRDRRRPGLSAGSVWLAGDVTLMMELRAANSRRDIGHVEIQTVPDGTGLTDTARRFPMPQFLDPRTNDTSAAEWLRRLGLSD